MPSKYDKVYNFYRTTAWKKQREYVRQLYRGVCAECGNAGWEVHHKVPLNNSNVDNLEIALGLDNLELLCTACHNSKRYDDVYLRKGLQFTECGNIVEKPNPPGGKGEKTSQNAPGGKH